MGARINSDLKVLYLRGAKDGARCQIQNDNVASRHAVWREGCADQKSAVGGELQSNADGGRRLVLGLRIREIRRRRRGKLADGLAQFFSACEIADNNVAISLLRKERIGEIAAIVRKSLILNMTPGIIIGVRQRPLAAGSE